jgi:HSP20 family protein
MYLTTRRPALLGPDFTGLRRLNRVLDETFGALPWGDENGTITSAWLPPVDIFEDQDGLKMIAELPGVRPEDVRLSIENGVLTIRGEKKQVAEEESERVHRYERSYGAFERTFTLPTTVDADRIEARCENGLLTVRLPKVEKAKPREIEVKVG